MRNALLVCVVFFLFVSSASASCGSTSCPIELHGLADEPQSSLDFSLQYIDQNHRKGFDLPTDHHEIRTINRIATLQLNYAASDRLRWILSIPAVSRSHEHVERATQTLERWQFAALGDLALQARVRASDHVWILAGAKFPTGAAHKRDITGDEEAEVTLQPGTGSTDAIVGATYQNGFVRNTALQGPMGNATLIPYFASIVLRVNGRGTHDYRRGPEAQINLGTQYPLSSRLDALAQINARVSSKDDVGSTGENRDLTGGRFLYASPGLRARVTDHLAAYGYVQIPLMQRVNGLQLTSRANYLAGVQQRF